MGRRLAAWAWGSAKPYLQSFPVIVLLQLATSALILAALGVLQFLARRLMRVPALVGPEGGAAASVLSTAWGWVLLTLVILVILALLVLDLCAKTAFAGQMVRTERLSIRRAFADGFRALRRFAVPSGGAVVVFMAAVVPVLGAGVTLSVAESASLPGFLGAVAPSRTFLTALYAIGVAAYAAAGFLGLLTFPAIVLDGARPSHAFASSARLIRANPRSFLFSTARFALWNLFLSLPVWLATFGLPIAVAFREALGGKMPDPDGIWILAAAVAGAAVSVLLASVTSPFMIIKLTLLYEAYAHGGPEKLQSQDAPRRAWPAALGVVALSLGALGAAAWLGVTDFDRLFPAEPQVQIIARSAEGADSGATGDKPATAVSRAAALGADGARIVLEPSAHTGELAAEGPADAYAQALAEAKALGLTLFVDLSGQGADKTLADEAVALATQADMLDGCVFVSDDYELVAHISRMHPKATAGFASFAAGGDVAGLQARYLVLEEVSATADILMAIHALDKSVAVQTADSPRSIRRLLSSDVDAIVTDEVARAVEIREQLGSRGALQRVADRLGSFF